MPDQFGREHVSLNPGNHAVLVDQADLHNRVNELVMKLGELHPITRLLVEGIALPERRYTFDAAIEAADAAVERQKLHGYPASRQLIVRLRNLLAGAQRWDDF